MELARRGATVVVVGRSEERCVSTVEQIVRSTGNASVHHLVADLSSQEEVRGLAGRFLKDYSRLDVLVNNAGTIAWTRQWSREGIEMTFALNHLGYFLLTHLLLDLLKASASSRIVNVSSAAHRRAEMDLGDVSEPRQYRAFRAYGRSKLANLMFTYEMARRLEGTGVTVNAVDPGLVATNLPANGNMRLGWLARPLLRGVLAVVGRSVVRGSSTVVHLATAPEVAEVTGGFFVDGRKVSSSPASYDVSKAKGLWDLSSRLTGLPSTDPPA